MYEGGGLVSAIAINPGKGEGGNDKVILWQLNPEVICTYVGNKPFTPINQDNSEYYIIKEYFLNNIFIYDFLT